MSREGITSLSSGEGGLGEEGGGAGLLDPAEACYLVASGWWSAVTVGGGAQRCQGAGASLGAMDDSRGLVCLMVGAGGMQIPGWVRQEVTAITSPKWVTLLFYFSFC